jgi:hypothetical protein
VYEATTQKLSLYVNGVLDNGILDGAIPANQGNANQNVTIGRRFGGYYWNGVIDEVRIYDVALGAAQIQADMNMAIAGTVGAPDAPPAAAVGSLQSQVYPNPFRDRAAIRYTIPREGHVRVEVFDVRGHRVALLEDRGHAAGAHRTTFEPRSSTSGLFLVRVEHDGRSATTKLLQLHQLGVAACMPAAARPRAPDIRCFTRDVDSGFVGRW